MTAEHDADALMSAITGESLPDGACADAAFMAEHRRAEADVALLREQLGLLGDTLAEEPQPAAKPGKEPGTEPAPVRAAHHRRRLPRLAFGALVMAVVTAVGGGMGWLMTQGGTDGRASGSSADAASTEKRSGSLFGGPRYLACASLVVEGGITAVEHARDTGMLRVTVRVTRSYKPAEPQRGADELVLLAEADAVPGLAEGVHVLLGVPQGSTTPDHWVVGRSDIDRERAWIVASLPESRGLDCP
ncbi:TRIC cation channel family protein [Streptomyces prasinus]|uniref:TRIC cation channel family protein n=1 Tax=Streptomyces prasinus TaxID=67345 RepID=UPI0036CCBD66